MKKAKPYFMNNSKWYRELSPEEAHKGGAPDGVTIFLVEGEVIPFEAEVSYAKYYGLGSSVLYFVEPDTNDVVMEDIYRGRKGDAEFEKLYNSDFV